jgi:hypothetical protein
VPRPGTSNQILAVAASPIESIELRGQDWHVQIQDQGAAELRFENDAECILLADMIHRGLTLAFERSNRFWRLSTSTRLWYRHVATRIVDDIEEIERVSFSTQVLGRGRIGVAFDFGLLRRSKLTLAEFFAPGKSSGRGHGARDKFDALRGKERGSKGSLIYTTGKNRMTRCFFHEFEEGLTCGTTKGFTIDNRHYRSLHEYYEQRHPRLGVSPNDSVAYVEFDNLRAKPVAAKLLRLRIAQDRNRPVTLAPSARRNKVLRMWLELGEALRFMPCKIQPGLWSPSECETEQLACPELVFGSGRSVLPPSRATQEEYARYYRQRVETLRNGGLFRYEDAVPRNLWIVTPQERGRWSAKLQQHFAETFLQELQNISGRTFSAKVARADDCQQIADVLQREQKGSAVIVFDDRRDSGAAYYVLSHTLQGWRMKRLTRFTLENAWENLCRAHSEEDRRRAERTWNDIIFHSVIDTLDQMDAIPWRLRSWPYEACVAIDVSQGRRYFGISTLICRDEDRRPSFLRLSRSWPKPDPHKESINPEFLRDKLGTILRDYRGLTFTPLSSVLVLRDGHECREESEAIDWALDRWKADGRLLQGAVIDVVDFHKSSVKDLRMWNYLPQDTSNALEGRAVYFGNRTALVANTGAAGVSKRSTADPSLLIGRQNVDMRRVASAVFALSQLNYSSPKKAHKYPQPLREVDELLERRIASDTRGMK